MTSLLRQLFAAILSFSIAVPFFSDPVGKRTQKISTLPEYPGGLTNYNANDQLSTDTYDANGNTTASGSAGYVCDFENHLISANGITYVYDGDGHRVSKTINGVTTRYATTDINPTGYWQVVGESYSPRVNGTESQQSYIYGLDAALELRSHYDGVGNNLTQQMYFVHDGHGSVRAITDQNGAVTDTYDYDAFGVLIHQTGTTPNTTLFAGEQFDPDDAAGFPSAPGRNPIVLNVEKNPCRWSGLRRETWFTTFLQRCWWMKRKRNEFLPSLNRD